MKNPTEVQVEKFFQPSQIPLLEKNQHNKSLVYYYNMKKATLENCTDVDKMQEKNLYL
jgi:hypothetical protein